MDRMDDNRIIIDGSRIGSREDFFEVLRLQIGAERLIGTNLDALHDALTSLTVHTVIEIHNEPDLEAVLGDYWKKVLWMLNDCLDENSNLELNTQA